MSVRSKVSWKGDEVRRDVKNAIISGLADAAEYILEEANRIVPHDEGTLMRSGETSVDASQLAGSVAYDAPYAARLHEHPEYNFQHGRQGKWLETTLKNHGDEAIDKIVKPIQAAHRG